MIFYKHPKRDLIEIIMEKAILSLQVFLILVAAQVQLNTDIVKDLNEILS